MEVYYFSDSSVKGGHDSGFGKNISWDVPLLEGYTSRFIKNHRPERGLNNRFLDVWNPGVWKVIRNSKAEIIIINGWTYSSNWLAIIAAKLHGKEVWLRAESPLNQELKKSKNIIRVKKIILKHLLFPYLVDKFLYIGTHNKSFFSYYGVPDKKLVYTPYSVDNTYFQNKWHDLKDQLPGIKDQLHLPKEKKIVVFSGKYISKKRPLDLLKAFSSLDSDKYFLVMVGDGALRPEMEQFIKDRQMTNVHLTGFINQSQIPSYYAVADLFVMCSGIGETWGLSVNEAMNFGKPVIVSDTCGCSIDLVDHGQNGFVFNEGDTEQLSRYIRMVLEDEGFCKRAGLRSVEIINDFSITTIVQNMVQAVKQG